MKLVSLNVGQPRVVETARGGVLTSIFKEPAEGRRKVVPHNVEGDRQSDLTVHGGPHKAVYAYALEHYRYWEDALGEKLSAGVFGENLTVSGLDEATISIGDVVEIGSVRLRVTQPRMPCFKLGIRFQRAEMVKRFWQSGRSGIYFAVERAGDLGSGDQVAVVDKHPLNVSVAAVVSLYQGWSSDEELYKRAMASPIRGSWLEGIHQRWTEMR